MEGWIKIHRSIINNWIFSDEEKFRAWIIILLTVNYESKKVNIGNLLLTCNRGESLLSLDSWSKLFGKKWNKSKVRRFFDLLQNDSMIVLKNEQKTTRLTVCKYDTYQDMRNANETQVKRKRNASETQTTPTKESKESKEDNINIQFNVFWNLYNKKIGNKDKCNTKWNKLTNEERQKIINTLPIWITQFKDKQFQPYPETYLNNKRWNDEINNNPTPNKMVY
jgi:hypothetical protein